VLLTGKFSKMLRKLNQEYIDGKIRGPPSYFTRLKQGYALPPLKDYMDGYDSIFSLDMPLKTRETNFLILNRQVWTEQKAFCLCPEKGGGVDQNCKLCGDTENTEHLIFACPEYSAMVWETFASAGDKMVKALDPNPSMRINIHNIMYANPLRLSDGKTSRMFDMLICEIKKDIIYRKYLRSQTPGLNEIVYTPQRVSQHIEIVCNRLVSVRKYQGRSTDVIENFVYSLRENY
jgi:hypothetical protein